MTEPELPRDIDPEEPVDGETAAIGDDVPEADALEQQRTGLADRSEVPPSPLEPELEADEADVDEQRRVVPTDDEERAGE
jgi:hypothetical protein